MTSTSGRSRTIRSPSATCCLTIRVLVVGQARRLAQDPVRDADLADVVEQAGHPDRRDQSPARARAARRGRPRSGRHPRNAASCSGPSRRRPGSDPGRRRTCASRPGISSSAAGHPDGVAAAALRLLEGDRRDRQQGGDRVGVLRDRRRSPALIVTGSRSDSPNCRARSASAAPETFDRVLEDLDVGRRLDDEELVGAVAAEDGAASGTRRRAARRRSGSPGRRPHGRRCR